MTHEEARDFIRNHFEEFVNRRNVQIGHVNFAADFVDHGADVPPGMPQGPAGAIQYVSGALKRWWYGIIGRRRIRRAGSGWSFAVL